MDITTILWAWSMVTTLFLILMVIAMYHLKQRISKIEDYELKKAELQPTYKQKEILDSLRI